MKAELTGVTVRISPDDKGKACKREPFYICVNTTHGTWWISDTPPQYFDSDLTDGINAIVKKIVGLNKELVS